MHTLESHNYNTLKNNMNCLIVNTSMSSCHALQPLLTNNKALEPNGRFDVSLWSFNCLSATCLLTSVRRWVVNSRGGSYVFYSSECWRGRCWCSLLTVLWWFSCRLSFRDWRYITYPVMNFGRSYVNTVSSIDPSVRAFDLICVGA